MPVEPLHPAPKRQRTGASWDEVHARLSGKWAAFDEGNFVRLLGLFLAISPSKTMKNPGQKLSTYEKHFGFKKNQHYIQKKYPASKAGSPPYWLTFAAAEAVYAYEKC